MDPIKLSQDLIRCPSVTPVDAGALDVLQSALESLGFVCTRLPFCEPGTPDVDNLYARLGTASPNLCFAGHTDVVPVGDASAWTHPPFDATIADGRMVGRGVVDMKCAIACFASAVSRFLQARGQDFGGSISFLITGDEEGPAINGTPKMLTWLKDQGESIDACIVGEPTNTTVLGETIKIGRRGSLNGRLRVKGTQGHVAYPHHADNPLPKLVRLLSALDTLALDDGTEHFQASNLEITAIDVGNDAVNIIPAEGRAGFNIRFNDLHTGASLEKLLRDTLDAVGEPYTLDISVSGEAFLTPPGKLTDVMAQAVKSITGITPALDTGGGTSDARFIKNICPVAEFGLMNQTAHKVDENAAVDEINALADIYVEMLNGYFA